MKRLARDGMTVCMVLVLAGTTVWAQIPGPEGHGVRRARRDRGLIEQWRQKPPIVRCVTWDVQPVPGLRELGTVLMDDRPLFEILAPAGGYDVARRTELVALRLERLLELKAALEPVKAERWGEEWVVTMGGSLVVTAATGVAQRYNMSRRALAERWADSLRTALHAVLGPGAQVLRGDPPVQPIRVTMPPWDDRYYAVIKGDRALERGETEGAVSWYRRAVAEDPSGYDARWKLGRALAAAGRLTEARDELVACLQIAPNYGLARRELAEVDAKLRSGGS